MHSIDWWPCWRTEVIHVENLFTQSAPTQERRTSVKSHCLLCSAEGDPCPSMDGPTSSLSSYIITTTYLRQNQLRWTTHDKNRKAVRNYYGRIQHDFSMPHHNDSVLRLWHQFHRCRYYPPQTHSSQHSRTSEHCFNTLRWQHSVELQPTSNATYGWQVGSSGEVYSISSKTHCVVKEFSPLKNSPLCSFKLKLYSSRDHSSYSAMTPTMFQHSHQVIFSLAALFALCLNHLWLAMSRLSRWQRIQQRTQQSWSQWSTHYLQRQQTISK